MSKVNLERLHIHLRTSSEQVIARLNTLVLLVEALYSTEVAGDKAREKATNEKIKNIMDKMGVTE